FFFFVPPPPTSTLFPYTTLFRSADAAGRPAFHAGGLSGGILHPAPAVAAALAVRLRRDDFPGPVRLSLLRDERRHARRAGLAGAAIPGVLHAVLRGAVPG